VNNPQEPAEERRHETHEVVTRTRWVRLSTMVAVVAAVAALDLAVKALLAPQLPPGGLTGGPIDLALSYNTGVGLSVGAGLPGPVVLGLTTAVIAAIVIVAIRAAWNGASRWRVIGLSLATGGALGNLIDRAGDGQVTDFIRLPWFTCNLADVAITAGIAIVLLTFLESRPASVSP
jgi:signal peptidase II